MKRYMGIAILILLVVGSAWYVLRTGFFQGPDIPYNPDSPEFQERMRAVDEINSQIDPNATPGVGVVPPGTLPPTPPPTPSTTTEEVTSTTESLQ